MNSEKLKQLQAQVRIGGKGTARRKKKVVHRTATTDDKKLQSSLKKLSVRFESFQSNFFFNFAGHGFGNSICSQTGPILLTEIVMVMA